ncbi:manganese efflux pump MntP family protein [Treponema sp.]|uniref:manganese efflux pump MntP n=1 Tax=Treponema sp. TaxID=166 RepID=UPI00298E3B43|nr:manganese efflux pump [Treponema sp.]MCR5612346.1 manganese efflux pump MntP family protein [Treponema sp.]
MEWNCIFFANSILLGAGLAMDAFSVSIANAMTEIGLKKGRMCFIAGIYAFFQFAMPMIGWICVHTIVEYFSMFDIFIPWIALVLLLYIGGKMIIEAIKEGRAEDGERSVVQKIDASNDASVNAAAKNDNMKNGAVRLSFATLFIHGIATSIDALSVGFTIADYGLLMAFTASLIIAVVTFAICITGLIIGKKAGERLGTRATLVGGIILVGIGIEIFVKGIFF